MRIWDVGCEVCGHPFEDHPYNKFSPLGEDPYSCQYSKMNQYGVSVYCECQGYSSPEVILFSNVQITLKEGI